MSHQVEQNGSCLEVTESFPQPPIEYSSDCGMLEVGEGPPAPPWLQAIVSSIQKQDHSGKTRIRDDTFVAMLFVMVHEVGFTVPGQEQINPASSFDVRILRNLIDLKAVDRKEFSYHVPLSLYSCDVPCELVIVPNSNIFIVNFHIPNVETFSISFNIDDFIALNDDCSPKFSNLNDLSKSFKDVCYKFRNAVLDHVDLPSLHITKIPYELLLKISTFLDPQSFVYFSVSCKQFIETLNQDELLWKRLFKIHFKTDSIPSVSCTWKKHFIDETKKKAMLPRYCSCPGLARNPYNVGNITPHLYVMRLPRI